MPLTFLIGRHLSKTTVFEGDSGDAKLLSFARLCQASGKSDLSLGCPLPTRQGRGHAALGEFNGTREKPQMSERASEYTESPSDTRRSDEVTISPEAAAILEFTTDVGSEKHPSELRYITSKDAYIWAGLAATLPSVHPDISSLGDIDITTALFRAVSSHVREEHLQQLPGFRRLIPPRLYRLII